MASPAQRLESALRPLRKLRRRGIVAIRSTDLSRTHRERLLRNGCLREVFKGWYFAIEPQERMAADAAWHDGYWRFCVGYLNRLRKTEWCLSPEQSIALHTGNWLIPEQLRVRAAKARNNATRLPNGLSLLEMRLGLPAKKDVVVSDGLRLFSVSAALVACGGRVFRERPVDLRLALSLVEDLSAIRELLLETGRSTVAGRLAGAFRNIGREDFAGDIMGTMRDAGYDTREIDPFVSATSAEEPPHRHSIAPGPAQLAARRIRLMWHAMRPVVIESFPVSISGKIDAATCLRRVDDVSFADAWHSLAAQGTQAAQVSAKTLELARSPNAEPVANAAGEADRAILLARGQWRAFLAARASLEQILAGADAAAVIGADLETWQRAMFAPLVEAGLCDATETLGHRGGRAPVRDRFVPMEGPAVAGAMRTLLRLLRDENHPSARAVLGHFFLQYIQPFRAGNERLSHLLMNVLLAATGLPWTIIPAEQATTHRQAVQTARIEENIAPLAKQINSLTQMLHLSAIQGMR